MAEDFEAYLKIANIENYLKKLKKKTRNKKVIIYGSGKFFQYIKQNYDISFLNVVGISDKKFQEEDEGKDYLGYRIIPKNKIANYNVDYLIVAMYRYINVIEELMNTCIINTKTKILPLLRMPFFQTMNKIYWYKEKLKTISSLFPFKKQEILARLLSHLITPEMEYVEKCKKEVIQRLKNKIRNKEKLNVAFLCSDKQKWKCQSLFELLKQDENFHPFILVAKKDKNSWEADFITKEEEEEVYNFFAEHLNLETYFAYDYEKEEHIDLEKFNCDIIFYQQPWGLMEKQSPLMQSYKSLTCYVPYYVPNLAACTECNLDFHNFIHNYYVVNETIKKYYSPKMKNLGKNLKVVGHTILDYFFLNCEKIRKEEKKYVIYAPHWSIDYQEENYATFKANGQYILDFAKKHPEINWIFKPHPYLKQRLKLLKVMTNEQIENYWNEWDKIGLKYEGGDYLHLFAQAKAMITDCGSFLTEFFLTEQPLIHLISDLFWLQSFCKGYYKKLL